jgi:orotate phosphoribosyltransferase
MAIPRALSTAELAGAVLDAGAVEIRDVDGGSPPFLYSSGNWGPGYVSIKGLVGQKPLLKLLCEQLAVTVERTMGDGTGFVAGNATGGMIPGWLLSEYLSEFHGRAIPFVYVRETRKKGGQQELITGIASNPMIRPGANALIVEELVNFAETTCNSATALRDAGFTVSHAACILAYDNIDSRTALGRSNVRLIALLTLPSLLDVALSSGRVAPHAVQSYRDFLENPTAWQKQRGLKPVARGGTI